jgi:hypothetical protein
MVNLTTNEINLKSSSEELFKFLSQPNNMAKIISFKKTKHLEVNGEIITFILKWAARFNFIIEEITSEYIFLKSTKDVVFASAFRFDISKAINGSKVVIHAETDTAPFVDFYFERQMKDWISAIVINLENEFGAI